MLNSLLDGRSPLITLIKVAAPFVSLAIRRKEFGTSGQGAPGGAIVHGETYVVEELRSRCCHHRFSASSPAAADPADVLMAIDSDLAWQTASEMP